jgi:hypothetical protein
MHPQLSLQMANSRQDEMLRAGARTTSGRAYGHPGVFARIMHRLAPAKVASQPRSASGVFEAIHQP